MHWWCWARGWCGSFEKFGDDQNHFFIIWKFGSFQFWVDFLTIEFDLKWCSSTHKARNMRLRNRCLLKNENFYNWQVLSRLVYDGLKQFNYKARNVGPRNRCLWKNGSFQRINILKGKNLDKFCWWMTVCQKVHKSYFQSHFLMSKIDKKNYVSSFHNINLGDHFLIKKNNIS